MKAGLGEHLQAIGRAVRLLLIAALLVTGLAQSASADTVYTYTGNLFDTFETGFGCPLVCSVSGSFTLPTALAPNMVFDPVVPTSYSFTDGVNIYDQTNSTPGFFIIQTDGSGAPIQWSLSFQKPIDPILGLRLIRTTFNLGFLGDQTFIGQGHPAAGEIIGSPGTWNVPEPSSLLLLGAGLLCLATIGLRRSQIA